MSNDKKSQLDSETILMTLDQIGQTIDIMTNVVGRLRGYITEQLEVHEAESGDTQQQFDFSDNPSQTIH